MRNFSFVLVVLAMQAMSPVSAHHGPPSNEALYFADELIEITGELTEVLWRNPHVRARVAVTEENGSQVTWDLHLGPSPGALESRGYSAEDFLGEIRAAGYVSRRSPIHSGWSTCCCPTARNGHWVTSPCVGPAPDWPSRRR